MEQIDHDARSAGEHREDGGGWQEAVRVSFGHQDEKRREYAEGRGGEARHARPLEYIRRPMFGGVHRRQCAQTTAAPASGKPLCDECARYWRTL